MADAEGTPLRWGVLAPTAMIARLAVVPALQTSTSATIVAAASLSGDRSSPDLAGLGGDVAFYRSYDSLLGDPNVEAVYIPLPNSLHLQWVEASLAAGKHVLCEKPLAVSASDAETMARAASAAGLVLLEAYMTPFHPRSRSIADVVAHGVLGEPRLAHAVFAGRLDRPGNHRWDPSMGGGALFDLGIYCIAPLLAFGGGEPESVAAAALRGSDAGRGRGDGEEREDGQVEVDASFAGLLRFECGLLATFSCSFDSAERQRVDLMGSAGSLSVERAFTPGATDTSYIRRGAGDVAEDCHVGGGEMYRLMVDEFAAVVAGVKPALHPLASTIAVARTVDRLRAAAGIAPAL